MALSPEQFIQQVNRALPAVMLVHSDEPLQMRELLDAVRAAAVSQQFNERLRFVADSDFDWSQLQEHACAMSLFAEKQLIDVGIEKLPQRNAVDFLLQLIENAGPSYSVLLHCHRLQKKELNSTWAKAALAQGVELLIWPPTAQALPGFIRQRLEKVGFVPSADAVAALVERVEGNLLAADSEIYKMRLIHPAGALDAAQVIDAVAGQARYGIDDLIEALAVGDRSRFVKVLYGLEAEGVAAVPVINALARETRSVLGYKVSSHMPRFVTERWRRAGHRAPARLWQGYLAQLGKLDAVSKGRGQISGNIWRDLVSRSLPLL